jgi:hypothetical protein
MKNVLEIREDPIGTTYNMIVQGEPARYQDEQSAVIFAIAYGSHELLPEETR